MSILSPHPALSLALGQQHQEIKLSPRRQLIALVFVFSRQTREPRRHRHVRHRGTVSKAQPSGTNIYTHRGLVCQLCSFLFPGISWRVSDDHCFLHGNTSVPIVTNPEKGQERELPPVAKILYGIFAETSG